MVLQLARKLAATVLGQDPHDPLAAQELQNAGVPVSEASCRTCADPCDEGHEEYAKRFDVDMESEMRGSVKPYRRQVLISTGKSDWAREVTYVSDSLARYISNAEDKHSSSVKKASHSPTLSPIDSKKTEKDNHSHPTGVHSYKPTGRLSILNGSHTSRADDPDTHATVLVLPDYVAVSNVPLSAAGADAFWAHALDPAVPRAGTTATPNGGEFKSWTLPYDCLILLCSHKKRDARCHIASLRLEEDFLRTLESEGWSVDTDLEDLSANGPPLETIASTDEEREAAALAQLKALASFSSTTDPQSELTLILKNSHIGGHKFAGNVIIYFPQGSSIWYGRVTPHEIPSIVHQTIQSGKVLPQLLRGALGVSRPGCHSLLEW
ncbi:uncharacterized protein FOMMEDRAFT_89285 [Fomitiporia mediterranea MF3/22]|uniref:uncharacterized protein n=1 Tax=Fomitiporia mediterranea (strain MF3/22) TaxID=694068 RepID=UPI0004409BA6|nr:uncharacterized protein FOMMEDRAFT_89285 [Fomitiporia mediterranea MF3/22]EJD01408.1 hypothetical protein FOMMEDRAFT_89285 [Fomitiporia mediterranea MF3/22]